MTFLLNGVFLVTSVLAVSAPLTGAGTSFEVATLVAAVTFGALSVIRALTTANQMLRRSEDATRGACPAARSNEQGSHR